MSLRFEITFEVDVDLDEPCTVQELARIEEVVGAESYADLTNPDTPLTALQTRAVIWSKIATRYPDVRLDQFDSIGAAVG